MDGTHPAFARRWMARWRAAAPTLAEQKRHELRDPTDEEARGVAVQRPGDLERLRAALG